MVSSMTTGNRVILIGEPGADTTLAVMERAEAYLGAGKPVVLLGASGAYEDWCAALGGQYTTCYDRVQCHTQSYGKQRLYVTELNKDLLSEPWGGPLRGSVSTPGALLIIDEVLRIHEASHTAAGLVNHYFVRSGDVCLVGQTEAELDPIREAVWPEALRGVETIHVERAIHECGEA